MNAPAQDLGCALCAGAAAGLSVDLLLFPIDTIKTRFQTEAGFWRSGGFRKIYSGLGSTAVGSMPGAALFFCTYESMKHALTHNSPSPTILALTHMTSASCAEVAACLVRVPTEVIKQRSQATNQRSASVFTQTVRSEGLRGLYRGYTSTVLREIPFSLIQFPIWEALKLSWSRQQQRPLEAWQSGVCGAVAGAVAAGLTTPLDVAKTRIMLASRGSDVARGSIVFALRDVFASQGVAGLFAGVAPRVVWISIGGCIFLGVYDKVRLLCASKQFS